MDLVTLSEEPDQPYIRLTTWTLFLLLLHFIYLICVTVFMCMGVGMCQIKCVEVRRFFHKMGLG